MKRSAPAGGYDFGAKRHYRRNIWKAFKEHCSGRLNEAQALLMPSAEGDEIDVALSKGFREANLHVVDKNAAIVAHLKRRYPRINTYGTTVALAAQRIADAGIALDVANLDLCSPLGDGLLAEVKAVAASGVFEPDGALLAVTMLRGREQGYANHAIRSAHILPMTFTGTDAARLVFLRTHALIVPSFEQPEAWTSGLVKYGIYRSIAGSQTMLWSIFRVRSTASCTDETFFDYAMPPRDWERQCSELGRAALLLADPAMLVTMKYEADGTDLTELSPDGICRELSGMCGAPYIPHSEADMQAWRSAGTWMEKAAALAKGTRAWLMKSVH
jgi:hypothetical protein